MELAPDTLINDRYRLIERLGRGSFGEVWLAEDTKTGIQIAIKIYIALDTRGIDEFKNEFTNVYSFNHTNLLRPDYFDSYGSHPFLVMPYCPVTLGNKTGELSETELWQLIADVSAGLAYLHQHDVVHRDIKPDNILQDTAGNYLISDFGLSKKMRSTLRKASARSNADNSSGTIGYMAPEMFTANPTPVKATDIWALGASIYELATGEMPFCGQGGVMELHGAELPVLPAPFSPELTGLMHKCLAKETWDRPMAAQVHEIAQHKIDAASGNGGSDDNGNGGNQTVAEGNGNNVVIVKEDGTAKKSSKVLLIIAGVIIVALIIALINLNSANNQQSDDINRLNKTVAELTNKNINLRASVEASEQTFNAILGNQEIKAFVNDLTNTGDPVGTPIVSGKTTYLIPWVTVFSKQKIDNGKFYVKFYTPSGLSTGSESKNGYSYSDNFSVEANKPTTLQFIGWGAETPGHWGPGDYRIEIWYDGKRIGSNTFRVRS